MMKKEDLFLEEAKRILIENMFKVDVTELYYATKLVKSIYLQLIDTDDRFDNLEFYDQYDGEWYYVDMEDYIPFNYTPYYLCVEFTDGRHLPVPLLAARNIDEEPIHREGLQQEIIKLGFKYCRALRRASIEAKKILYKHSTFKKRALLTLYR